MAKKVAKLKLKRESGYLYYLGKDGNIWRCPMKRGSKKTKKTAKKPKPELISKTAIKRIYGYLYYLDKDGDLAMVKMKRSGK